MKKIYSNLKTSDKITFLFTAFNFIWLLLLLLVINITYFFIWYSDQKDESWYDMNRNYSNYIEWKTDSNLDAFKQYILKKDTLIIPNDGSELICSNWVETKIHDNIDLIKDDLFYKTDDKIFIIYSKVYPEIWEVKVFFDTTPYIKSQIIIIKISLFLILISLFIFYFLWKKITKYSFINLNKIAKKAKELDIEKDFKKLKIIWNKDDEINILANTINDSFSHIKIQTSNLKQFITDVSHEFKTPLMVINSRIDLYNKKLEKSKITLADTKNLLSDIKQKTKKLDNLLETFLLLSRVENNIEKLEKTKINFSKYISDFSHNYFDNNEMIKDIEKNNFKLNYKIKKDIYLDIEENTFNILFWNLLSNAIKFSKTNITKNKNIEIEIWLEKNNFWIKDNWIWIDDDSIKNIFSKFYRTDKNIEWFWVWLFLVKRLSDLYNWEISVESQKGKWTNFIVKFK